MPGKIAKEIKKRIGDLDCVSKNALDQARAGMFPLIEELPATHPAKMFFVELEAILEDVVKRTTF